MAMTREERAVYQEKIRQVIAQGPYIPDWNSLWENPVPSWFSQAKFGIFIHWGLYSVPAHGNEWYSRNMYIQGREEWEYHRKTYGPQDQFGYKDFIPMFHANNFRPEEWAMLFKRAGARYFFPVAEHHDGFQMYKSRLSRWNSQDMGPGRDILGEWKKAGEKEGLVFGTSSHRAEHWFFMGHGREFPSDVKEPMGPGDFYWPAMEEPDHQCLTSHPYPSREFVLDWILRTCEIIDNYCPALLYFDWWVQHEAFKEGLKTIAAYYYNRGNQWGRQVSICYKHDAMMFGCGIPELERGGMGRAVPFTWQTDTAIANNSWCYTDDLDYKTPRQILCTLIRAISQNGNLLLNVGPKGDGSVPEKDREILEDIGSWMEDNGEAVYKSRPWRVCKEGPAKEPEGQFQDQKELPYTREDIYFTVRGDSIYGFVMNYPEDGNVTIRSLAQCQNQDRTDFHGIIKDVGILGFRETPVWHQDGKGLHVRTRHVKSGLPVVIQIKIR